MSLIKMHVTLGWPLLSQGIIIQFKFSRLFRLNVDKAGNFEFHSTLAFTMHDGALKMPDVVATKEYFLLKLFLICLKNVHFLTCF